MDRRVLPLEGIHNFRDYGGYAARGGRLRTGLLWRSGQHGEAQPADLATVHALGITTVIDLRGDSERAGTPCRRHPNFAAEVLFVPGETAQDAAGRAVHEEWAGRVASAEAAIAAMVELYERLPFRPTLVGTMGLYLRALADRDGASLLHCVAGKDRTGVAVAVLHALLGVHPDDIREDYLLTNTAGDPDRRIAALRRHADSGPMDAAAQRVLLGVDARFLDSALGAIRARHGSIEAYAADLLGADARTVEAIAARLIA